MPARLRLVQSPHALHLSARTVSPSIPMRRASHPLLKARELRPGQAWDCGVSARRAVSRSGGWEVRAVPPQWIGTAEAEDLVVYCAGEWLVGSCQDDQQT